MKELNEIQAKLSVPKTLKNLYGGYMYRSAEKILEALKPLLNESKCTLTINDDIVLIGERYYIKATATIRNEKGETETTTAFAREALSKKGMAAWHPASWRQLRPSISRALSFRHSIRRRACSRPKCV